MQTMGFLLEETRTKSQTTREMVSLKDADSSVTRLPRLIVLNPQLALSVLNRGLRAENGAALRKE